MPLSDKFIRTAKPGKHADMGGLQLKVYPTGRKAFQVRFRKDGKDEVRTIGEYPAMSLAAARKKLDELKSIEDNHTLDSAFDDYYASYLEKHFVRPEVVLRTFLKDISPSLGKQPLITLTKKQCTDTLDKIVKRGSPVQANRTFCILSNALDYFKQKGWMPENVLEGTTRKVVGGKEKPRSRNLSFDEIQKFFELLRSRDHNMSEGTRWTLHLILLTGLRASEALSLADNGDVFTKEQRIHRVPLTPHVRALLKRRPHLPRDHRVLSHALRRLNQDFTPHDLRRTFASRMADLGVAPHVVEKLLDHQMVGVMAVYNHAEYWPERVAAQHLWGCKLASIRRKKSPD